MVLTIPALAVSDVSLALSGATDIAPCVADISIEMILLNRW